MWDSSIVQLDLIESERRRSCGNAFISDQYHRGLSVLGQIPQVPQIRLATPGLTELSKNLWLFLSTAKSSRRFGVFGSR